MSFKPKLLILNTVYKAISQHQNLFTTQKRDLQFSSFSSQGLSQVFLSDKTFWHSSGKGISFTRAKKVLLCSSASVDCSSQHP